MKTGRKGFTLIELIIVTVIIGILASISAPMITSMKARAVCAEAVVGMGTIRTVLRNYYAIYNDYPAEWKVVPGDFVTNMPADTFRSVGLDINELTGSYFGKECYQIALCDPDPGNHWIACTPYPENIDAAQTYDTPGKKDAQNAADNEGGSLAMNVRTGRIYQVSMPRSGYPAGFYYNFNP